MKRFRKHSNKPKVAFTIIFLIFIFWIFKFTLNRVTSFESISINLENVSAIKIQPDNLFLLKSLSEKYELDFSSVLTCFLLESKFEYLEFLEEDILEHTFIQNYENLKNKYKPNDFEKYYKIINTILNEIKSFPIPITYSDKYIYGDSWGAERTYGGKRIHMGTDIMDRENIVARIPIISMTEGTIENLGWNEKGGYRVGIRTQNGNYYYYAHLENFKEGLSVGDKVYVGDTLGFMGNTGYSKIEGTKGNFEVHLHMGIEVKPSFTKSPIWINPYPFLRIIELEEFNKINN